MSLSTLSTTLWQQRRLLELLVRKLEERRRLSAAGRARCARAAARELERLAGDLSWSELLREVEVEAVAPSLGLRPAPRLVDIAAAVRPPWDDVYAGHLAAYDASAPAAAAAADLPPSLVEFLQ